MGAGYSHLTLTDVAVNSMLLLDRPMVSLWNNIDYQNNLEKQYLSLLFSGEYL